MRSLRQPQLEALREEFRDHGQEHVFAFWDQLEDRGRSALAQQARRIGRALPRLMDQRQAALAALEGPGPADLAPCPAIALPEHGGDESAVLAARELGEQLLRQGRVAVLVVAGGQGTRLGFPGPKGAFPIGPVSDRSLFGLQAQKLAALARRSGRGIHWFIMTSPATDSETRALFEQEGHFGLDPERVSLFSQSTVPAWTFDGKLILERPDCIFESPGGHGDTFLALAQSGALDEMANHGIDRLFYYQVDNPLVRLADPLLLGFHEAEQAAMSCKVIRKVDPMEKLGVMTRRADQASMVEYTELPDAQRHARDSQGRLLYWAGNIGIHVFNLNFLRRMADDNERLLPYHASPKKIPTLDTEGRPVAALEPNGHKLERFVFDALPAAERVCVLEVRAEEEFAPIKNAEGKNSPEVARARLTALYTDWMTQAGLALPRHVRAIEIDHSFADSPVELADRGLGRWQDAPETIRILTGTGP